MIDCLWTRVRKQPIIALYFESENKLKFYNLEAWSFTSYLLTVLTCDLCSLLKIIVRYTLNTKLMFIISLFYLSFAPITLQFIKNTCICCTSTGQAFPFKRKLYKDLLLKVCTIRKYALNSLCESICPSNLLSTHSFWRHLRSLRIVHINVKI